MLWAVLCVACPLVWRSLRWRLRTGSCVVGTKPYRTTTCPVVWAAGLAYAGTKISIVLQEAGCSVEDAGVGPRNCVGALWSAWGPARILATRVCFVVAWDSGHAIGSQRSGSSEGW